MYSNHPPWNKQKNNKTKPLSAYAYGRSAKWLVALRPVLASSSHWEGAKGKCADDCPLGVWERIEWGRQSKDPKQLINIRKSKITRSNQWNGRKSSSLPVHTVREVVDTVHECQNACNVSGHCIAIGRTYNADTSLGVKVGLHRDLGMRRGGECKQTNKITNQNRNTTKQQKPLSLSLSLSHHPIAASTYLKHLLHRMHWRACTDKVARNRHVVISDAVGLEPVREASEWAVARAVLGRDRRECEVVRWQVRR
jgi:hypothetical protein